MKDLVTQSEVATFCDCRVKHDLSYNQLLKLKTTRPHFHIGSVFHKWLEFYYINPNEKVPLKVLSKLLMHGEEVSPETQEEIDYTLACLESIALVYPEVDPIKRFKLTVLRTELLFEVQDPNVPARKFTGKIDVLAKDKQDRLWIMDHKVMSRIDRTLVEGFNLNRQMQTYLLAARLDKNIAVLGRKIGGIIPNLIRKPQLRRKETESEEGFNQRVATAIREKPEEYFYSDQLYYDDKVNKRFESSLWPLVKMMRQCTEEQMYPNFSQCETIYGRCPFHATCSGTLGHESLLTKKTCRHEELEPEAPLQLPTSGRTASTDSSKKPAAVLEKVGGKEAKGRLVAMVQTLRGKKKG